MRYTLYNIRLTKKHDTVTHKQMYETGGCDKAHDSVPDYEQNIKNRQKLNGG